MPAYRPTKRPSIIPQSEAKIQSDIVVFARNVLQIPKGLFFSIPNDGQFRLLSTGMVAGMPDLCWLHNGTAYFFETKTPGGVLSDKQRAIHKTLTDSGFRVWVVRSVEDFITASKIVLQ